LIKDNELEIEFVKITNNKYEELISNLILNLEELEKIVISEKDEKVKKQEEKYICLFKKWLLEQTIKNQMIKNGFKKESVSRPRQEVFWIDFGVNIGSEFSFPHFGVVIKEFNKTAIVVPLSTQKEDDPEYKNVGNLIVPIGELEDLPADKKPCFALINQIKVISKSRINNYKDKNGKFYKIVLNENQMKLIFDTIKNISEQKIITKNISKNTCNNT
jgi:uncharacterized protein YifN (PemK superfamily)